jgi:acetyltransferase-like isoleucine patch superfamily enzyme
MMNNKYFWGVRHLVYKLFFGKLEGVGYFGKPFFLKGIGNIKIRGGFGIFPGSRLECMHGGVILIGRNVRIGHCCFMQTGSSIEIGDNVVMSANVFIGTTDYSIGQFNAGSSFLDQEEIEKPIIIGDSVFIGYGAVILPGAILENGCVVGANSVVKGRFNKGEILAGVPAKSIRKR